MTELFLVGGLYFWVLIAFWAIALIALVENERWGSATLVSIVVFFALARWGDFNILIALRDRPLIGFGAIAGYLITGVLWSFGKWWFFVKDRRNKYEEVKARFLEKRGSKEAVIPHELKAEWTKYLLEGRDSHQRYTYAFATAPSAREHKSRITTWMAFWPWSLVWTLINDPLRKLFEHIYQHIQRLYQSIADRLYAGVEEEMLGEEEIKLRVKDVDLYDDRDD